MQTPEENDEFFRQVTTGMARGEEEAYRRFYEACFDRIFRHLLVRTRGAENLAQELAQIVLLQIVRYIKPFSGARIFWAWLYQLCRSAHVDWLRRNAKLLAECDVEIWYEHAADNEDADAELLQHLGASLPLLEPQEQELLQLVYFEGAPQKKIAERLQSTPKAIESKLARIRHKLRRLLIGKLKEYALF